MRQFPFSRDEVYRVMQFFLDERKAAEVVDSLFHPTNSAQHTVPSEQPGHSSARLHRAGEPVETRSLRFESVGGITFTEDTLILLSLLSSETEAKVNEYRQPPNLWRLTPEEESRWQERRRELEGLPEVREWRAKFGKD